VKLEFFPAVGCHKPDWEFAFRYFVLPGGYLDQKKWIQKKWTLPASRHFLCLSLFRWEWRLRWTKVDSNA
jgi:hypothetical protein